MKAEDFFNLVTEMRKNQKDYFKTRSTEALRKSKEFRENEGRIIKPTHWMSIVLPKED